MLLRFERDQRCVYRMFASSNACSSVYDAKREVAAAEKVERLSKAGLWLKLAKSI